MKRNPILWSTLRQPVRSLLFLLVIAVASFAFVARAVEYLVIDQETERLMDYYRPIGYLEPEITKNLEEVTSAEGFEAWWLKDVAQGIPIVSSSPYVDWQDQRRYCSGVLEGIQNTDLDGSSSDSWFRNETVMNKPTFGADPVGLHLTDLYLSGTLVSKGELPEPEDRHDETMTEDWYAHRFVFQVDRVEAGFRDYAPEGTEIQLLYIARDPETVKAFHASVQEGQRYLIKALADCYMNGWVWTPNEGIDLLWISLQEQRLEVYPLEPGAAVDWEELALQDLQVEVKALRENASAMAVIGVQDMSALPRMQEATQNYYLVEGRWLNVEDNVQGRRVCVVHKDFAAMRGLSMGDTLTIRLRDLKAPPAASQSGYGYSGTDYEKDRILIQDAYILEGTEDWEHWQEYPTETETFEIVGVYGSDHDPYYPYATGSINLYIPDSCMPEGYGQETQVHMDSFSFRLRSAEDTEAFLQEVEEPLAEMGMQVRLMDKGWENFAASAKPIQRSTALNAGVLSTVLALVLGLFAFLYLRQKRREFAIQRALGAPKGQVVARLLLPVSLLGLVGIVAGGLPAWRYALGKAGETLVALQNAEGLEVVATLSAGWLVGLCVVALLLLLVFTGAGACWMAHRPVLDLLQGEMAKAGRGKK